MRSTRLAAMTLAAVLLTSALRSTPIHAQQAPPDSAATRRERTVDSLATAVRALQARLDSILGARARPDTGGTDELAALRAAASLASSDSSTGTRPQQTARLGANAMNPEISATGDIRMHARSPGAQTNSFETREFEFGFQSALDPFSTAKIFISAEDGQLSIEEGYAFFTALPAHIRLDVGQFRQTVGEVNRWHLHALNTGDYPLVVRRFAGDEGLAAPGISAYAPLPFSAGGGAYELTVQSTVGSNGVLEAGGGNRPSVNAQLAGFWQLSRSTYAQVTASGLYGTNPDTGLTTTLSVLGARFTWRPPSEALSREFTIRGELWSLHRKFDLAGPAFDDRTRLGGFADATWKLNRQWIAGLRGDYVESADPGVNGQEWAVTPTLTFWPSEFVFVRGQYERARLLGNVSTDRLSLQLVFAMGPHKHELF